MVIIYKHKFFEGFTINVKASVFVSCVRLYNVATDTTIDLNCEEISSGVYKVSASADAFENVTEGMYNLEVLSVNGRDYQIVSNETNYAKVVNSSKRR